jgi:hypothetical protein
MLPTVGRIAGTYAADFSTPPPAWFGVAMAVALYGFIGAVIARAMGNSDMKQALFAGIAAPAIVLSVLNGATESKNSKNAVSTIKSIGSTTPLSNDEFIKMVMQHGGDERSSTVQDFVWGLGASRDLGGKNDALTAIITRMVREQKQEPNL